MHSKSVFRLRGGWSGERSWVRSLGGEYMGKVLYKHAIDISHVTEVELALIPMSLARLSQESMGSKHCSCLRGPEL